MLLGFLLKPKSENSFFSPIFKRALFSFKKNTLLEFSETRTIYSYSLAKTTLFYRFNNLQTQMINYPINFSAVAFI